jgi:hypothetical protein
MRSTNNGDRSRQPLEQKGFSGSNPADLAKFSAASVHFPAIADISGLALTCDTWTAAQLRPCTLVELEFDRLKG